MKSSEKLFLFFASFFVFLLPILLTSTDARAVKSKDGVFLDLYQEPYQQAFYILIPKGWKAEGGMIPSGVQWNVVDLVVSTSSWIISRNSSSGAGSGIGAASPMLSSQFRSKMRELRGYT